MNWQRLAWLMGLFNLLSSFAVQAQLPPDVRSRLSTESVVSAESHIYAKAITVVRGTIETAEQRAVTDALRLIANKLCGFELRSDKRLEAAVVGAQLVASNKVEGTLEVVVRVPQQKPTCRFTDVPRSPLLPSANADIKAMTPDKIVETLPQTRLEAPSDKKLDGISVRVLSGEY